MAVVYLVRHPRPADARRLCYGRSDVAVQADALEAAIGAARAAIPSAVLAGAHIFTSPSSRCARLARELAAPGEPTISDDLREMGFGRWEGLPWDDVPRAEIDAWARDVWGYRAGGDESAAMVRDRWQRFLAGLRSRPAEPAADVVAVTHSGVIRVALVGAGLIEEARFPSARIDHGSVHRLELDRPR